jgi:hypothetical protein
MRFFMYLCSVVLYILITVEVFCAIGLYCFALCLHHQSHNRFEKLVHTVMRHRVRIFESFGKLEKLLPCLPRLEDS